VVKSGFGDWLSEFLLMAVTVHAKASFISFHSKSKNVFESHSGSL
jgi:hypothetical protein